MKPTDEQQEIVDVVHGGSDTVIEAGAGCLAADTIINVNRGGVGGNYTGYGKGSKVPIEHVARQVAGNPVMTVTKYGKTLVQRARRWDLSIPTYVARADGDVSRLGVMSSAWFSGVKETFEVVTESDRKIRATATHPFLVDGGVWATLEELVAGNSVCVSTGRSARYHQPKLQYRSVHTRFHPYQVNASNTRVRFKVPLHRAIIEAEINGISLECFIEILRMDAERSASLHFLGREWHVHHKDRNSLNNERSNLQLMTEAEHHALHSRNGTKNHVLWQIGSERVVSIKYHGEEPTFDVEVADDPHNFLANGFVVHNTGKTSTLKLIAANEAKRRGMCVYFNKAPAAEARRTFPSNVSASTAHKLAFDAMRGRPFMARLDGQMVTPRQLAEDFLGIKNWFTDVPKGRKPVSSWKIASMAVQAVKRFCYTDAEQIEPWHVERLEGIVGEHEKALRKTVLPLAREIWADLQRADGWAQFTPDHFMKIWALEDPELDADFIMVDESQDTNGVLAGILRRQDHMQRIFVGDSCQRLFSWRGSVDMMAEFGERSEVRYLTQSFRFGDAVAEEANRWLEYLEASLRLRGLPSINSRLEALERPDAILCRTNADTIEQAMDGQERGFDVAIVGDRLVEQIVSFANAAAELKRGEKVKHRDLSQFKSWGDVVDFVNDGDADANFATSVRLIQRYGAGTVQRVCLSCVPPRDADFVISTVHKVKGMEWPTVYLDAGLMPDEAAEESGETSKGELMVGYVAATRAREVLDVTAIEAFHDRRRRRRRALAGSRSDAS